MVFCAWKEICLPLPHTSNETTSYFIEIYIKASFDLLDWTIPVRISTTGQIFYRWIFRLNGKHNKGFIWQSSQRNASLYTPDLVYSELHSQKGVVVKDSVTITGHTQMNVCIPRPHSFIQSPLFWVWPVMVTSENPSSGTSSETSLLGQRVEGNTKDTFVYSESVLNIFPLLALPSHHSLKLLFSALSTVSHPHICVVHLTIDGWAIPWGKKWKEGRGRGQHFFWFRFFLYKHSKLLMAWVLLSFLFCYFRQLLLHLASQLSTAQPSFWCLGHMFILRYKRG